MVKFENKRIAFRCPDCGKTVIAPLNLFSLSGKPLKLECECGCFALEMEMASDGKIRVKVPCLVCCDGHRYKLAPNLVFDREIFVLSCAYSGLDICFFGDEKAVDDALEKSEKELLAIIDYANDHADEFGYDGELDDTLEDMIEASHIDCDDSEVEYEDIEGDDLSDLSDFLQYMDDCDCHDDGCDCHDDGCDCQDDCDCHDRD